MMLTLRLDRGALASPRVTNTGALVLEGHAARVHRAGDGLNYGTHHEYRTLDEVRRIVEQLPGAPLTWNHPDRMVRGDLTAATIGRVDHAFLDGEHAAVRLTITDARAANAIRSGSQVELSLGYECVTDATNHQRNITVDHLAVVERARCGATCRLVTDSAHTKESTVDPQLIEVAKLLNVNHAGLDERALALAVIRAAGTDPTGPCSSSNPARIDSRENAYVVGRAVSAAEYAVRDHRDAARRDTFATAPRNDAGCGCGGHGPKLNPPMNLDARATEREARDQMLLRGRTAYATEERRDEVSAFELRDQIRAANRASVSRALGNGGAGREAAARAAMQKGSANAWRTRNTDDTTDEER